MKDVAIWCKRLKRQQESIREEEEVEKEAGAMVSSAKFFDRNVFTLNNPNVSFTWKQN